MKCERSSWKLGLKTKCGQTPTSAEQEDSRPKVQAQRKFAQSPPNSPGLPVCTRITMVTSLTRRRPKTEDFLSFLCLRGSAAIPRTMTFLSSGQRKDTECVANGHKDRVQGLMSNGPCAHMYGTRQQRAQRTGWTEGRWPLKDNALSPRVRPAPLLEPAEGSFTRHIFQMRSNRAARQCGSECLNTALVHLHRAPSRSTALPHKTPDSSKALALATPEKSTTLPCRLPQRAIALKHRPAQRSKVLLHKKTHRPAAPPHRTPQRTTALQHRAPERTATKKTTQMSSALPHGARGRSATKRTIKTPLPQSAQQKPRLPSAAAAHRTTQRSTVTSLRKAERSNTTSHRKAERSTSTSHRKAERSTTTTTSLRKVETSATPSHRKAERSTAASHRAAERSTVTSHRAAAEGFTALPQRTAPGGGPAEHRFSRRKRGLPPDGSNEPKQPRVQPGH